MKWPDAVSFDPLADTASPAVEAILEGPGSAASVLVLAVGPSARKQGWAAQTAIALAQQFVDRGENVILADLSLEEPELHRALGTGNEEGLTDVFLFGASLSHIAQLIPVRSFRLIPASQFTPDASEVLRHERWGAVFEELAEKQSKLLAYLPVDVAGAVGFSERAGHTIVLADAAELAQIRAALSNDTAVIGVLTPPAADKPAPLAQVATKRLDDSDFEKIRIPKDAAREALIADMRKRQRAALMAPPPAMTPLAEGVAAPRPPAPVRSSITTRHVAPPRSASLPPRPAKPIFTLHTVEPTPARQKSREWLTWLLIFLLAGAIAAAVWFLLLESRFTRGRAPVPAPPPVVQQPVRNQPAQITGSALPYSVAIGSYQVLALAQEQLEQLSRQQPELSFYIGPIVAQGTLFYRVMAGPVADSAEAVVLRDALVDVRIKTGSSGWDVLATPYAFLIGEFQRRDEAEAKQQEAVQKGIPSYIVTSMGPDGSAQYRLYAGAFMGPGDAEFMRQILKDAGLPDNLVERTGSST